MEPKKKSEIIKKQAINLGFDDVGITNADFLKNEKNNLEKWLKKGYNAGMKYMENNFNKRLDQRLLVDEAKSIIVVLKNYYPKKKQNKDNYLISKYAYGKDYHKVLKNDLYKLFNFINEKISPAKGRVFVDSAPVLEKKLAKKAGLGWIGKNSLLLTKKGSYFFIGEIISNLELFYDKPYTKNFCGNCNKCINACPNNAITEPFVIDANKCISYQTIERKNEFEQNFNLNFNNYIFGCDICQDVCPWNKNSKPTNDKRFEPKSLLFDLKKDDWENLSKQTFNNIFGKSAVKRTKYKGLFRNIEYLKNK